MNHEPRRRQIAEAVWRIASARGLEDVSLRKVAAEAGVSLRLVQYYFGTRDDLLLGALEILDAEAGTTTPEGTAPREILRTMLVGMLPLDDDRRTRYLVHLAYFARSRSGSAGSPERERLIADLLAWGQDRGEVPGYVDVLPEAALLITLVEGLRTGIVLGRRAGDDAVGLIDHQLDRLFSRASVAT